jgi:ribosome maturation factor RimP
MTVEDCERLSRDLSPALDVEDPMERAYHLEVSSPGIDRPLVRARDFQRFIGHEARIELADPIGGRKRFRGLIAAADADSVTITLPDAPAGADPAHKLPLAGLSEAKLIMTDALIDAVGADQDDNPIDDDEDIETVEYMPDDDAKASH